MICVCNSFGLNGIEGYAVTAECDLSSGLPSFDIVGLPDTAVKEARERVRAAVKNSGFKFPVSRITINLAPAGTKKTGTMYDLPILVGMLSAMRVVPLPDQSSAFIGELGLDGTLRPVNGVLSMALSAARFGITSLYLPAENANEATLAEGLIVYPVHNINELVEHLTKQTTISPAERWIPETDDVPYPDFSDVKGQDQAKRALEIAAAGGHNILLVGPPGSGKSMLSKRLPSILPEMTQQEELEVTQIYSVLGKVSHNKPLITARPFRSPHHTVSAAALAGGGTFPRPGEISLAHNGVLFLDELPEFRNDALEIMRQPLEDGNVTISRINGTISYPAQFMLVCAMNPCKCGWYGDPSGRCTCSQGAVDKYLSTVSGPLLDRIDMIIEMPVVPFQDLSSNMVAESSAVVRERVNQARALQQKRFSITGIKCNAQMGQAQMRKYCKLDVSATAIMKQAFDALGLTARSYDRILRVARTIADLDGSEVISVAHLAEAIRYRSFKIGRN